MNNKRIFSEIYDKKAWVEGSGPGSTIEYCIPLIVFLSGYIKENNIKSMVDIGCGDIQWMSNIFNNLNISYTGIDVVDNVININKGNYPNETFICADIFTMDIGDIPDSDMYFMKDVLQHWTNDMIQTWLDRFFEEKPNAHFLTINCDLDNILKFMPEHSHDRELKVGEFSPLNKNKYPLSNYKPIELFSWETKKVYRITK
tara:strand:+ start:34647 stop:35249 length:603 start_codon:yes stop_codon:yes gene_type:complete